MIEIKAIKDILQYCDIVEKNDTRIKSLSLKGCWQIHLYLIDNLFIFQRHLGGCFTFDVKFLKDVLSTEDLDLMSKAVLTQSNIRKSYVDCELLVHNWSRFCTQQDVNPTDLIYICDEITDFFDRAEKREDISIQKVHDFLADVLQNLPYGKLPLKEVIDVSYTLPRDSVGWDEDFEFCCKFLFAMNEKYLQDFLFKDN